MAEGHLQAALRAEAHRHAQVHQPLAHAARHLALHRHVQLEADARAARLEVRHHRGQELVGEALGRHDAHLALTQAAQGQDVVGHALDVQPGAPGMGGQQFAGGIERHAAGATLEQQGVQLALQPADLPADGRRRHLQPGRGLGDGAGACHLQEVAQGHLLQHALVGIAPCRLGGGGGRGRGRSHRMRCQNIAESAIKV